MNATGSRAISWRSSIEESGGLMLISRASTVCVGVGEARMTEVVERKKSANKERRVKMDMDSQRQILDGLGKKERWRIPRLK